MKRILLIFSLGVSLAAAAQEPPYDVVFFANSRMSGDYFYSNTKYSGTSWIKNSQRKLPVSESIFFTPGNSLQLQYVNGAGGKWSAAVYRKEIRGQDHVKEGKVLSFKLYIASPGTRLTNLPAVQLGFGDSSVSDATPLTNYLSDAAARKWMSVMMRLDDFE